MSFFCTGVEESGDGGRLVGADRTGDNPNSSKSGVSMVSISNEKVVSSVLVAAGDLDNPGIRTAFDEVGAAVVVAILVIGRDSRRPRSLLTFGLLEDVIFVWCSCCL
jgi:hypothetical protein